MTARVLSAWPPLPPRAWAMRPRGGLPFPLEEPGTRTFRLGRGALRHGIAALGLGAGDEVLAPAYHHGSEIEALLAGGVSLRFYTTRPGLRPDARELDALVSDRTRALLVIHVLGLPQPVLPWRRWCDARGLLLLEDAAQAWLAEVDGAPVGRHADLAIFCLYKTYGVPDGAALVVRGRDAPAPDRGDPALGGGARRPAAWIAQRSQWAGRAWTALRARRGRGFDHAADIALGDLRAGMSPVGLALLRRLASPSAAAARRANYRRLLEPLGELVCADVPALNEGSSPLAFPIRVADKDAMLARLRSAGIEALDFWSRPHPALPAGADPLGDRLRGEVVGLPVHQELSARDLRRIAVTAARDVANPHPN